MIGYGALKDCASLVRISIPSSVREVGELAFEGCTSLESVFIAEGVTTLKERAFNDCKAITSLELPVSLNRIEKYALPQNLKELIINSPEMYFDKFAFNLNLKQPTIIVPAGRSEYYRSILPTALTGATVKERAD